MSVYRVAIALVTTPILALALLTPAGAQQAKPQTKSSSAWVKICTASKDGTSAKPICFVHHERIDATAGRVLLTVGLRDTDAGGKALLVTVPAVVMRNAGLRLFIASKEDWAKVAKGVRVDPEAMPGFSLPITSCGEKDCFAEAPASESVQRQLKTNGGLLIFAIATNGKALSFPVPLTGFREAFAGAPVDNAAYGKARRDLLEKIQKKNQGGLQAPGGAGTQPK